MKIYVVNACECYEHTYTVGVSTDKQAAIDAAHAEVKNYCAKEWSDSDPESYVGEHLDGKRYVYRVSNGRGSELAVVVLSLEENDWPS